MVIRKTVTEMGSFFNQSAWLLVQESILQHPRVVIELTITKPSPRQLYIQITTNTFAVTTCFGFIKPFSSESFL
jgi:hypothetical protein